MMCSLSFGLPVIILRFIPNKTPADTEMGVSDPGRVTNTRYMVKVIWHGSISYHLATSWLDTLWHTDFTSRHTFTEAANWPACPGLWTSCSYLFLHSESLLTKFSNKESVSKSFLLPVVPVMINVRTYTRSTIRDSQIVLLMIVFGKLDAMGVITFAVDC